MTTQKRIEDIATGLANKELASWEPRSEHDSPPLYAELWLKYYEQVAKEFHHDNPDQAKPRNHRAKPNHHR